MLQLLLQNVIKCLKNSLSKNNINAKITGRIKHPISILCKLHRKRIKLEQLTDILAARIIVLNEEECYKVLEIIHDIYEYEVDKFKNYISNPKANGYQSIHTVILTKDKKYKIEVQIRDTQMHYHAEYGSASHREYKNRLVKK